MCLGGEPCSIDTKTATCQHGTSLVAMWSPHQHASWPVVHLLAAQYFRNPLLFAAVLLSLSPLAAPTPPLPVSATQTRHRSQNAAAPGASDTKSQRILAPTGVHGAGSGAHVPIAVSDGKPGWCHRWAAAASEAQTGPAGKQRPWWSSMHHRNCVHAGRCIDKQRVSSCEFWSADR